MVLDNFRKINITLNKANQHVLEPQITKVGDVNGRELVVQLIDGGVIKDQTGVVLKLNWQHANGNQGSETFSALDAKQGVFSVYYPQNMLYRGTVTANISINENGKITNSLNFQIAVKGDVFDGSAVEVDGALFTLKDLKNQIDERDGELESLENRQDAVENQFISLQHEMTDKDVISAPEIIAARLGAGTLADRISKISKDISNGVATTTFSSGGLQRKPVACITFDDGYMYDFNLMKPIMDEFGVKGTIYVNINPHTGEPRMTETEIKQMASDGWEFGSHTKNHSLLSFMALSKPVNVGDSTISVLNTYSMAQIKVETSGTKLRVEGTDIVFTVKSSSLSNGVLTLTLDAPSTVSVQTPKQVYLHEEDVLKEILAPKEYLNSLGIPSSGIAYPFGNITDYGKNVVKGHFSYGRNASNGNAGTNGGITSFGESKFKQFNLNCSEIPALTDTQMDDLIAKVKAEKGMLVFLGHTNGWSALEPKLRTLLTKLKAANIDIETVSNALKYHANASEFGDFVISKDGNITNNGVNFIGKDVTASTGAIEFPKGITLSMAIGTAKGFPTPAGRVITIKSDDEENSGAWTTYQFFLEQDSFSQRQRVYHRLATSGTNWSEFVRPEQNGKRYRVKTGSKTIPARGRVLAEVKGISVTNQSTPIIVFGAIHDYVRVTPSISGAKLYVVMENISDAEVTWEQELNVKLTDELERYVEL